MPSAAHGMQVGYAALIAALSLWWEPSARQLELLVLGILCGNLERRYPEVVHALWECDMWCCGLKSDTSVCSDTWQVGNCADCNKTALFAVGKYISGEVKLFLIDETTCVNYLPFFFLKQYEFLS